MASAALTLTLDFSPIPRTPSYLRTAGGGGGGGGVPRARWAGAKQWP